MDAIKLISTERFEQRSKHGFDAAHDDSATKGEIGLAAMCYLQHALGTDQHRKFNKTIPPSLWPWDAKWWKPKSRIEDLTRAGALIAAEIERNQRMTPVEACQICQGTGAADYAHLAIDPCPACNPTTPKPWGRV